MEGGSKSPPMTTTISTIAVQSGSTRIVIALLQSREWLELRVVEMTPELTLLGATLAEATAMLAAHEQVLLKIHSKQSPVEELLRQADQLIASQHTKAEVYTAMAESLSIAWQDINTLLHKRKEILELNVKYHSDAAVCMERTRALEMACSGAPLPVEVSDLRDLLMRLSDVKRSMLESLMAALQDGRALLDSLRLLATEGSLDSRPGQTKVSTESAISQVEHWLEDLHDRRRTLEVSWQSRKTQLEQCLALALLTTDLRLLEEIYADRLDSLGRNCAELGDSVASAELLLREHQKLLPEAKELQEQGLKILRATEQLAATGHFAGEEAIAQAYQLLNTSTEYQESLERREQILHNAMTFFSNAQTTLAQLKELDQELAGASESQLSRLQDSVADVCSPVLQQGYAILEDVPEAKGVKNVVEELEDFKLKLNLRCSAMLEENVKATQAFNNFLEKQTQLYSWLVNTMEAFIQGHQDMGSVLAVAKDFLQQHQKMLGELQVKGTEINALLSTVPELLSTLDESKRTDIEDKAEALHTQWTTLRQVLEQRTQLSALYVKFHTLIVELATHIDSLTESLSRDPPQSERRQLEEEYSAVSQLYAQLGTVADNFTQDSYQTTEPYLAVERARLCVDTLRQHFTDRVAGLQALWQQWEQHLDTSRLTAQRWALNMADSNRTVDWVRKLDSQLYPVLDESLTTAKSVVRDIEERRERVLSEIRRAQAEVQLRLTTADEILSQAEPQDGDHNVLTQLRTLQERLQQVVTDYQVLLEVFISFFRNLAELEHTVQGLEGQYGVSPLPLSLAEVEKALREHDASRQAIQELFKFAHTESQQIIAKIRQQEPDAAAEKDTDSVRRMLEGQRTAWERAWTQHRMGLESQQQLGQFDSDLLHIHGNIDELSQQLSKVKGQFGENLAAAKATSLAFHYFEKTIELLEQRIETFVASGEAMLKSNHSSSPHIEQELHSLRSRWQQFHRQVSDTRQLIDLSLQYFALVEEAEDWFREGSRLLMTIAKRSSSIRTPQEANGLLQEIELFLKPGESKQDVRIQKISELAFQLYGSGQPEQLHQVKTESREMLDSFSQVSLELQQIINFLNKPPEEQRMEIVGLQEALPIDEKPEQKSPSPPPKKAKVEPETETQPPNFTLPLHDATIDEGSRFTFECRVTGIPMPEICWLKDNLSIDSNLDYHTKVEDGLCSLTIEETFTEDSACFTCRATNLLGYAETTALLTVRENEREAPPHFSQLLAPVSDVEGSLVHLECRVVGIPLPTVQWYRDGECVDLAPEYTTTYNNGVAVLTVEQLGKQHQGLYSCKATNRLGTETTSASLSVQCLVSEKAPEFVVPLSNVMARAGQKIRLECELSGVPEPHLEWTHNGTSFTDFRDIKVQQEGGKVVLTIAEAFPKDAGTYSVIATNAAGSTTSSCTVAVKGRLPTETSDSELASDLEPSKPSIPTVLRDLTVCEGGKAKLDCIIIGQPEPEVIWYHEGVPIKESKEVQLLFQGDRCSLIIAETLPEDAGQYKVVAINSGGEASSSCQLTVQGSEPRPEQPAEISGMKPLFISLLTDALATEGDSTSLECAVRGDPTPTVSWFLNNNPLLPSDRLKMEQDVGGLCTLVISPVVAEDRGVYTARAANPLGEAKCFAHLIVRSAANLATAPTGPDVQLEERATVPAFTELFADRTIVDGGSTKFECIVTGKPTPKVRWLYNGEPVSGKDFLPSVSGSRQVLIIPVVSKALAGGKVTCVAENDAGKASCNATLTVSDAPPVDDLMSSLDQLNLSETSVFELKREVFMQSSSHTQFGAGEPIVQVHGMASKTEQTSQKIGDKPVVQVESHKTSEYHNVGGVEQKFDTQSQSTSVVEPGALLPAKLAPQRKQLPPRFITPVMGKIVNQGADVTLECILEGFPSPSVSWKRNGKELLDGDRVKISWALNKAQCQLTAVVVEDAGKYSCTAVNPVGTATCTADLVIKKTVFPPVFGRRLQADTVAAGKRVVLEVEVTGTPEPDITWYKDGNQIASSSSMFRVLAQGNSHRLIIEHAGLSHSGRYEVRAVNSGGEARSSADLLILEPLEPTLAQPTGLEMDMPLSTEFSSPKHSVTVTESFKSDKKISLHVERSSAPLDLLLDLPTLSVKPAEVQPGIVSEQFENVSKQEETKLVISDILPEPLPSIKPTIDTPVQLQETAIEDSSISKKSALSYFQNIIKGNEEDTKGTKPTEPIKKSFIPEPTPAIQPVLPPLAFEKLPESVTLSQSTFQESSQQYESIYTSNGFFLQPEPPPEMGYISKSQVVKGKEDMADRVKKLEESHRALSQEQIPSGGVRIFPSPSQKVSTESISTQTKTLPSQSQNVTSETISTQTSFFEEYVEPPKLIPVQESSVFSEKIVENLYASEPPKETPIIKPSFNVTKFELPKYSEPLKQEFISESFDSFQSKSIIQSEIRNGGDYSVPKFEPLGPIVRPSADLQLRPQSPRPSAEGVHMEKLWASKQKEEYIKFPHASPTIDIQQPQEQIQHLSSEKTTMFQENKHAASPLLPGAGKLLTPGLDHQRPTSVIGERSKSPSAEGLAMDKLWAHKTSTQKKVWPPTQQKEDSLPIQPWVNKGSEPFTPEKVEKSSEVLTQKENITENNVKFEAQSFSKVESSSFQSSKFSETVKKESAFKEVTPTKPVKSYVPPPTVSFPESKIIYVAEAHTSHSTNVPVVQPQFLSTETNFTTSSHMMEKTEKLISDSTVIEEKVLRPSETFNIWPPAQKEEKQEFQTSLQKQQFQTNLKKQEYQTSIQKQDFQTSHQKQEIKREFSSTIDTNSGLNDIKLEPGPPPELGFAGPPRRKQSYVETIEQDLEKNIDKVPSRHLAGAVRIIPPPQKKEKVLSSESTTQKKTTMIEGTAQEKKPYVPESISKPLPKLEPFPFKPDPPKEKPVKCPPPPRPSRFVKGSFTESDYESDCDAVRIPVKWNPWQSDSEDYSYRKVKPPLSTSPVKRPHSAAGQVIPPTQFETPPPLQGPVRPVVTKQSSEISKSSKSKISKTEETYQKSFVSKETKTVQSKTPVLKPGSPPQFVETSAPKHKPTAGKPGSPKSKQKSAQPESGYMADTDEPPQQLRMAARVEESMVTRSEQSLSFQQQSSSRTSASSLSKNLAKKESTKTEVHSSTQKQEEPLEPFPFKPDAPRPGKRPMGPPPPSPSKFVKGEFRESDYESEYEGKIRPIWRPADPTDDMSFRPVRPVLTPVSGKSQNVGRVPTPPTEFDEPPSFSGPPRPKFEPIDKPKSSTKVKETVVEKSKVIRPTPVQAQAPSPIETIYATPASKSFPEFILKPGSPPKMDFAPPPGYVEKSNIVNFTESTASSKRVVSVQQTTRVMQFGNSSQSQVQRKENVPPKQFVPAFSKESDYESDVDGVVNRPVRTPYIDAEKKRLKRVEEMKRRFLESEPPLQLGEPPQYAYSPDPSSVAYSAASKQMNEMTQTFRGKTQKFVSDIMTDIKSQQKSSAVAKPALKPPEDEPQSYRDETRHSEFGTKHIDPDTGLIYFKYDFGYEFGIVLPGEQKPGASRKVVTGPSKKEEGAVDFPVIHETSQRNTKKSKVKSVKWEPTSESEMSEIECERIQRAQPQSQLSFRTPSPHSLSPSVQSLSPYPTVSPASPWLGVTEGPQIVRAVSPGDQPKKAPLFITPLRDIACVSGQPARFECIVLAEPTPSIVWSKDGSVLQPSPDHQIEYRNGVCRLVLPLARPFDAGQYTCQASNPLGSNQTSASLQVPGERRSLYQ